MRLADRSTETLAALAMAYASGGKHRQAMGIVEELEKRQKQHYVLPYNIAKIYAAGLATRRRLPSGWKRPTRKAIRI